ncbi:Mechanosensitive ion channel-domain-containing protein [Suillus discolor]|uniref:Mechanosensitive ion channel-domain-containing protein n=1 Tax=Suillus discolor TaxID=1912936 RepID=A0A9P7FI37_9AGAM|nr:Mechanosensitive ion channel-domain-containing protein [Suillus discolor]KAG2119101.1 Mechanosensitive ion channel-domain-containing protein [Suillus discolor]
MKDRLRPPPSFAPHDPLFASDDISEENHFVNSTPSSLFQPDSSTTQLVLDRYPSQESFADRSQVNLMINYETNIDRSPQCSRQESGSHPSQASITQTGTQKPSVHYHEDVISPSATGSYFGFPKSDSRQSSDDEDEEDEFDWSGDEDLNNEEAEFEKKMGVKIKSRGWGIIRLVTLLFSSLVGSTFLAAVLTTPALLIHFFWYKPHPTDYRHFVDINVEAWLFWAAANVVISWGLAMIIDIIPAIILVVIAVTWGHVSESVRTKLELYASTKDTIKPLFYAAGAWLSWIILFQNIFKLNDSSNAQNYAPYTDRVAQVIEFLFFFTLVVCIQRMLSHAIAFAFHRTAYKERLDEVKKALRVIETLRNYKPKSSARHKSNNSHPRLATFTGLNPFSDKEHYRLRSESSAPSEGDEADVEDGAKLKNKGKGKYKQRKSTIIEASEDLESSTEQVASIATTPATQPSVDNLTTHKYPPTPSGPRSVDPHTEDPTIVVQAAKALKTAVLHDARNVKGATDELEALVLSMSSTHEAKRLARAIYRTFRDRRPKDAFRVFDVDDNGDISRSEIKSSLLRVYKERRFLWRSMHDVGAALKTLDQILLLFALGILFLVSLSIFGVNVTQSLTSAYSLGLAASFVFKNSASNVFDAIMFLFVTHPFDTGDRCFIDNENLVVKRMDLFATVFARSDGTETYYFNSQLFTKFITNVRRSDKMAESCTIQVAWRTPQEKLDALEAKLNTWLSTEENRWFQPTTSVVLQNISYQRYLECTIGISHNSDWGLRNTRRTAFHAAVQYYCRELGITAYEAPMPIAYADANARQYNVPQEAVLPNIFSGVQSPDNQHSPDRSQKSFLGFTPPRDQGTRLTRAHTRVRKGKSRKAAVRGVGADGGGNG